MFDSETKRFVYARGGHNLPYLIRDGRVSTLEGRGVLLGVKADIVYESSSIDLLTGDKIIFYSDGLVESTDADGKMFENRMVDDVLPSLSFLPIDVMVNTLYSRLLQHHGISDFDDDICIIGIEVV